MPVVLRKRKAPEPAPTPVVEKKKKASAPKTATAKAAAPKATPKAAPKAASKAAASKAAAKAAPKAAPKSAAKPADASDSVAPPAASASAASAASAPAATKKKATTTKKTAKEPSAASSLPAVGSVIDLDSFGGEIETNEGEKTSLKALVEASTAGVVLFTYPKASTPGCTKQACMFRDEYTPLTAGGLAIYGLSNDSPKANTTFKTNQKLPYPLLCDPEATLIGAIGLKKEPKGTTRGVFVVDKSGKVLAAEAGSPDGTVAVVRKLVEEASKE